MSIEVTTQADLNAAIAAHPDQLVVIKGTGWYSVSSGIVASGSASVEASGSASVRASGSASVEAYDSASVEAYDSASVRASGSASVEAYGSASVEASGSASVRASGSASVEAYGSASVEAGRMVAIHNHHPDATDGPKITGGVVIDVRPPNDIHEWLTDYGVQVDDGVVVLYKAVHDDHRSDKGGDYTPGTTPVADDWDGGKAECGGGLHFCARPAIARDCFSPSATRFVACPVKVEDIAWHESPVYPQKVKARGCCAPVWEVDVHGNRIEVAE